MPRYGGEPPVVVGKQDEACDRALAALVISIHEIDGHASSLGYGAGGRREHWIVSVADCALPEAKITRRNIEVTGQAPKHLGRAMRDVTGLAVGVEIPAIEHRQSVADVAKPEGKVDGVTGRLGYGPAALDLDPVIVHEPDLLGWILRAGRRENRPDASQQSALSRLGRTVRGTDRRERSSGENKRATGCGQRRVVTQSATW